MCQFSFIAETSRGCEQWLGILVGPGNPLPTGGAMQPGGTQPAAPWGMATGTRPGTVPFGLLHVKP